MEVEVKVIACLTHSAYASRRRPFPAAPTCRSCPCLSVFGVHGVRIVERARTERDFRFRLCAQCGEALSGLQSDPIASKGAKTILANLYALAPFRTYSDRSRSTPEKAI